nr:MAG TPA: hypothetical protein [Caudoviricetes sp.]
MNRTNCLTSSYWASVTGPPPKRANLISSSETPPVRPAGLFCSPIRSFTDTPK